MIIRPICSGAWASLAMLCFHPLGVGAQPNSQLTRLVEWQDTITLEENEDIVNVTYNVALDPMGGFLVADAAEGQFRRYERDGSLVWAFGRSGDGPDEFRSPTAAMRLPEHESHIVFVDRQGKLAVYDEDGDSLVSTARFDLTTVEDIVPAPDGQIWLASGTRNPAEPHLLHLIDPYTGAERARMFAPPISEHLRKETLYINWSGVGLGRHPDTLWAVTATRDTLYALHQPTFSISERIPIESDMVGSLTPATREEWSQTLSRREWAQGKSFLTDVFPLLDGRFIILFQQFRSGLPIWGIMLLDRRGSVEFEVLDTHRLLAVDPVAKLLFFQDRSVLEGNRWLVGRLR